MRSEWLDRADRILNEARRLPPGSRTVFVERACGDDRDVSREVKSLLATADKMDRDFLEQPLLPLNDRAEAVREGSRLGVYRVCREIGRGGMGRVFLAERDDGEYEQVVTIKVPGGPGTEDLLRRFRRERQILARLQHPYITAIFDGGTTADGLPYFVMEHIEGEPIHRHCDERQLTIRERLKLFRKVCSAVHFAHQNRVVHLDLKPENVLIIRSGEPKLLDFGIARFLEPAGAPLVTAGPEPMTPGYASPEQLRGGPITTASDVYSLGAVLNRLLTGSHPPPTAMECCEVSAERIGSPRARVGDLDRIVLKALAADPQHRYASVEQLSDDLLRHLKRRPV